MNSSYGCYIVKHVIKAGFNRVLSISGRDLEPPITSRLSARVSTKSYYWPSRLSTVPIMAHRVILRKEPKSKMNKSALPGRLGYLWATRGHQCAGGCRCVCVYHWVCLHTFLLACNVMKCLFWSKHSTAVSSLQRDLYEKTAFVWLALHISL